MRFAKEQRVTVPGMDAQGVILDATENIPGFPVYAIRWLDEKGESHLGSCGEGDLDAAQPETTERFTADDYKLIAGAKHPRTSKRRKKR